MKSWQLCLERFVDRAIPFWLVGLAFVIIASFFTDLHAYEPWVTVFDVLVSVFFVADLWFKWCHIRRLGRFLRLYWFDVIAVFPFYLIFRMLAFARVLAETGESAQKVMHEIVLVREARLLEEAGLLREAEVAAKEAKGSARFVRLAQRTLRFLSWRFHAAHTGMVKVHSRHVHK